jgi:phosphatidylserine decarboxylase
MSWKLVALGGGLSMVLMLPLTIKWKLTKLVALVGGAAATVTAALLFLWIYPLCQTRWGLAAAVLGQMAVALVLALSLIMVRFWRDPERVPPEEDGVVLSPADGKVIYAMAIDGGATPMVKKSGRDYLLRELTGTSLLASTAYVIGVEMSLLDVHVTRCSVAGLVKLQKHIKGKFISLGRDEAPFVNARLTTIIENPSLSVAVVQVASRLVRRVEGYLRVGDIASAGQRLGMIRFGSLVATVLPRRDDVSLAVQPGDRVKAGVSVLARYDVSDERAVD